MRFSLAVVAGAVSTTTAFAAEEDHETLRLLKSSKSGKSMTYERMQKKLSKKLGPNTRFIETTNKDFVDECYTETWNTTERSDWSVWDVRGQPSGLCMGALYCSFEDCLPFDKSSNASLYDVLLATTGDAESRDMFLTDTDNPAWDIPSEVLFPRTASDIVAAVDLANKHSLELSVKNSGHNYAGASTKAGTLLINMNEYKKYSPTGLVDCAGVDEEGLDGQPCKLALARGKNAAIRVGGGESGSDLYTSVKAFNEELDEYKYHAMSGAAGTVSPMGWTWQGGLGGTTGGRLYGFGVDQVLQIEAVLPNGEHVRFGPTKWVDEEGYDVPKTLEVSGECNHNADEADESKWMWGECRKEINFEDLWWAYRGAGFGTFGVVSSVYLQVHDFLPYGNIFWSPVVFVYCGGSYWTMRRSWYQFSLEYFLRPEGLGVPKEDSDGCGTWSMGGDRIHCYGEGVVDRFFSAWEAWADDQGLSGTMKNCPRYINTVRGYFPSPHKDYADYMLIEDGPYVGKIEDQPGPGICTFHGSCNGAGFSNNVLLPLDWLLADDNIEWLVDQITLYGKSAGFYWAMGTKTATSHDQMSSLSDAHRKAGAMVFTNADFAQELLVRAYDLEGDEFPAYIGGNHATPLVRGPLKDNWMEACPDEMSREERDKNCMSLQDTLWGSESLRRLEEIKFDVDPNFMFDCTSCVGNNLPEVASKSGKGSKGADSKAGKMGKQPFESVADSIIENYLATLAEDST